MVEPAHARPLAPTLTYPAVAAPGAGKAVRLAPGVLWIRMPLPPGPLSHINVWAIEDGEGWAVVDTGMRTAETIDAWIEIFAQALDGKSITRVLVTHMHPDHIGLAGWMTRRFGCCLWMTRTEFESCRALADYTEPEPPREALEFYRRCGWNQASIEDYRSRFRHFGPMIYARPDLPENYRPLEDGEQLVIGTVTWRVVVGYGHSPGHACLHCPELKLLISGDQVLPRISSNISVYPDQPKADRVSKWLDSLDKLTNLVRDDALVLPAHGDPFHGLHARLAYLGMDLRLAIERVKEALRIPRKAIDLFEPLFFSRDFPDPMQHMLATGEVVACLNYLAGRGEAAVDADPSGVLWYRAT